jgi:uncharacterized protein (TIRG00374 family)
MSDPVDNRLRIPDLEPERGLAETEVPRLGSRVFRARNIFSFFLALAILYLVFRQGFEVNWETVWRHVRGTNLVLFALAFSVFYCSYYVRSLRWRVLLENVGYGQKANHAVLSTLGLAKIIYLAQFVNCITVARLGDLYRAYLLRQSANISFVITLGTIVAERLLDLMVVAVMLGATVLIVFHGALPQEAIGLIVVALALSLAAVFGLLAVRSSRTLVERLLPARIRGYYRRFERGTVGSFRRIPLVVAYSVAGWVIEGATMYLVAAAVGSPISVVGALMVALIASLLSTIPVTPSGLGITEVGTVLVLQWLGMDANVAGAIVFLNRLITYWSIVFLGFILYVLNSIWFPNLSSSYGGTPAIHKGRGEP